MIFFAVVIRDGGAARQLSADGPVAVAAAAGLISASRLLHVGHSY